MRVYTSVTFMFASLICTTHSITEKHFMCAKYLIYWKSLELYSYRSPSRGIPWRPDYNIMIKLTYWINNRRHCAFWEWHNYLFRSRCQCSETFNCSTNSWGQSAIASRPRRDGMRWHGMRCSRQPLKCPIKPPLVCRLHAGMLRAGDGNITTVGLDLAGIYC